MKLIQRIGYYLGGFSIGLIILAFFLSGKKTSCDYGPNARVVKNINLKTKKYSEEVLLEMQRLDIDSAQISRLIKTGDIDFSESETKSKPCKRYVLENEFQNQDLKLWIENCDSIATIERILLDAEWAQYLKLEIRGGKLEVSSEYWVASNE